MFKNKEKNKVERLWQEAETVEKKVNPCKTGLWLVGTGSEVPWADPSTEQGQSKGSLR